MKYYAIKRPDGSWIMRSAATNERAAWDKGELYDVEAIKLGYTCVEVSGFVEVRDGEK